MPNPAGASGLQPSRHISGGEVRNTAYPIASGYASSIFNGDPVMAAADGSIQLLSGATPTLLGVFKGCKYTAQDGSIIFSPYWPAGTVATNIEAIVFDDPDIVYRVRSDATGVTKADIHALGNLEVVAGDVKTGVSKTNFDASAGLAATGKMFRILAIVNDGYNEPGPNAEIEVVAATSGLKGVVAGVGGA